MGKAASRLPLAISAILLSVFALSAGDAIIKLSSSSFPIWQIYVLRSVLVIPVLFLLLFRRGGTGISLNPANTRWIFIRSCLLVAMWISYYAALSKIDLSLAAAAYYTSPLLIVLLSSKFTGDRVGWRVRIAVALGFAGVLVMLRPGSVPFDSYMLLPFIAALLYALAMIITREKCATQNPILLALFLNIAFIVTGVIATAIGFILEIPESLKIANPFVFGSWTVLGIQEWRVISALALAMLVGSIFAAVAYQIGPASVVATFDYSYLVFAGLWGIVLFAETPDVLSIVGMMMIAVGGVLAVRGGRESLTGR